MRSLSGREAVACALRELERAGADAADAVLVESDALEARVRGEVIDTVVQARERTLGLRALRRGDRGFRSATSSTSDLAESAISQMAREAAALAAATADDPAAGLPDGGFAADRPELQLLEPRDRQVELEARIDHARRAESAARALDPRIVNSEGSQASSEFARITYGNSAGFLEDYESGSHVLFAEPIARQNGAMQRDAWISAARRLDDLEAPESVGRRAAQRALARLGARPVATCEAAVIFDPTTAPSLLRHLAGCVNGYAIYRGASYLAGRMGEQVASDLVSVVDDGRLPGGLGSKPFDAEGLPTRRNPVVQRGRLGSWLLDSYSARKLGLASTGNAARGAGSPPTAAPTNLWLEPGEASLEEIVADTPRGLLVTELIGMGFNPVTGDYSRGAAGLWIEDGRLSHPVEEVTIAGQLEAMLLGIDAVGSDLLWLGRVAAPSLRVARMTIGGR